MAHWDPWVVPDENCPIFVAAVTGDAGLGDQLETYIFSLSMAKLLNATLLVDGFAPEPTTPFGKVMVKHKGREEYPSIVEMLGIRITEHFHEASSYFIKPLRHRRITVREVLDIKERIEQSGNRTRYCNSVIFPNSFSCGGRCVYTNMSQALNMTWSHHLLKHVEPELRNNNASEVCKQGRPSKKVNLVWHVRSGDICLKCKNATYYSSLISMIQHAAGISSKQLQVTFVTQEPVKMLETAFPRAAFHTGTSMISSVCDIISSDIFVTTGSSLAVVAAFAPQPPIILEERRKEAKRTDLGRLHHIFPQDDPHVITMEDGVPTIPLRALREKLKSLKRLLEERG